MLIQLGVLRAQWMFSPTVMKDCQSWAKEVSHASTQSAGQKTLSGAMDGVPKNSPGCRISSGAD